MTKAATLAIFVIALNACFFATKQDIDKLQQDINTTRVSSSAADSVQRVQLIEVSRLVRTLNDSISTLSKRLAAMRTASESDVTAMRQDISQLQDLSGQSEQRLRDVRAALEEKRQQDQATVGASATDTTSPGAGAPSTGPGPLQLLQAGRDQLLKGGNASARSAFSELITKYPKSEYVPEAMFYTAQAFAAERNMSAADAEYSALITKYPNSPRVPTAMYKRALQLQASKKTAEAKKLYQDIIKRFPRSDEAALADERLQSMR
jgi:tol-pal system protein YbgF